MVQLQQVEPELLAVRDTRAQQSAEETGDRRFAIGDRQQTEQNKLLSI